mmetsp:Transcript_46171/g.92151  ORF Transcript_46171/g.92151 Transcript_46171/m.92151 type:complete len:88 (-) Transcript_46171:539-802(-)
MKRLATVLPVVTMPSMPMVTMPMFIMRMFTMPPVATRRVAELGPRWSLPPCRGRGELGGGHITYLALLICWLLLLTPLAFIARHAPG